MATQFSDMALGGESGFAAGYTPIRFAPLVSLTGPILGPATPTATAPAAPTAQPLRLPMMGGMAEMPDNAYMTGQAGAYPDGMPPIGARSSEQIRGDLMNLGGFFMSPIGSMLNYAMTGQTPAQAMQEMFSGAQRQQGQGMFSGLRDFLFGQQQPSVPLGEMRAPAGAPNIEMNAAVMNDARAIAENAGLSPELADYAAGAAVSMVAQGMDPAAAVALATQNASMAAAQMDMASNPFGQPTQQGTPTPNLNALNQAIMQGTSTMEQFGPQQTGGGYAPSDFGGAGANAPEGSSSFDAASSGAYGYF